MARWDEDKKLFYYTPGRNYETGIKDTDHGNFFRSIFPYTEVPKIDFDMRLIPIQPADDIFITDTTFRDGQQSMTPFSVEQIERLFEFLHRIGGERGLIRASEFFLYSRKDRAAVEKCLAKGYEFPEVTSWIRASKEDLKLVREMGIRETGMLTSVSDYHIFLKLGSNRRKVMDEYLGIVKEALSLGIVPRCHFEDITRADIYGFCVPFARELMRLKDESGIDIKIRLCDTLGFGVSFPGAALPRAVDKLVRAMIDDAGVSSHLLEWHGHNDFHKVLTNATTAWLYGCGGVNGAILGFGERTGNTPVEAMVIEYLSLRGHDDSIDTRAITEMAEYVNAEFNFTIPPNYPFVGENFNVTRAGIHADGLVKNEEIYNIFDTRAILGRPIEIAITDKSGKAGIAHWVNRHFKLSPPDEVDKRHPGISRIYKHVVREYEDGRITSMSDEELEKLTMRFMPQLFLSGFDLIKFESREYASRLIAELIDNADIRSMDPARQEPVITEFIKEYPFIQFAYVTDMNGIKITQNITQPEYRSQFRHMMHEHEDCSDREWFIKTIEEGKLYVSGVCTSRITRALIITVSAPITDDNDEMVGVLGLDIRFEDVVKVIQSVYESQGMQMSTRDLQKYQHLLWEELHRITRTGAQ
ncbi:MAG: triose-phosphate isomerase [Desulfomonilia bacterium]|uniref:2-isopropylmalate synthase n=1 Tax=anaerobic digester metagenome TaxID=1263854 RepID=A0A485LYB1_9ZZZZ|nr:cache domain-containing protein [Pseudomonadota bacterium]HON37609.1 cache domain-containing protein [Deltaproteobacteria bacterium]HRS55117.1 cache domain-containing protein [Desulfomonilia bacterium]HPD21467.1 cache domain-containing protein [Deltaproteobacteria bacterium]HPX19379.1 cache domain-containing protein [Deltaproteobacteria bacterium]